MEPIREGAELVELVEAAIRRTLHEHRFEEDACRADAARRAVEPVLEALNDAQRQCVLERLARRNPPLPAAPRHAAHGSGTLDDAPPETSGQRSRDFARQAATLARENVELRQRLEEVTIERDRRDQQVEELRGELELRARKNRDLERQYRSLEDEWQRSTAEIRFQAELAERLQTQVIQEQKKREDLEKEIIRLKTEFARNQRDREAARTASRTPPDEAAPAVPAAEPAIPATVGPPSSPTEATAVPLTAYRLFRDAVTANGSSEGEPLPDPSELCDGRLGMMAAALVRFEEEIGETLVAQLEQLRRRMPGHGLAEYRNSLERQGRARGWRWCLQQSSEPNLHPEKYHGRYISQLSRANFLLHSACWRVLTETIQKKAKALMHPAALRQQADASKEYRGQYWAFYENGAADQIPRRLADECLAEFAQFANERLTG